jgi:hypothetical protein
MNSFRSTNEESPNIRILIANLTGVIEWSEVNALIGETTVFVVGFEDKIFSSEACLLLLNDYPQLKIFMLRSNSDEGIVYWLALHCQQMQIISSQAFIESIRQVHLLSCADRHQSLSFPERNG